MSEPKTLAIDTDCRTAIIAHQEQIVVLLAGDHLRVARRAADDQNKARHAGLMSDEPRAAKVEYKPPATVADVVQQLVAGGLNTLYAAQQAQDEAAGQATGQAQPAETGQPTPAASQPPTQP